MSIPDSTAHPRTRRTALLLLVAAVALLYAGHYIQFDDTSGFGDEDWVMPFAALGVLAALASVVVAWRDQPARRVMGTALFALDAFLLWQAVTNDGFRFIWHSVEGEFRMLVLGLGLTALVLVAASFEATSPSTGTVGGAIRRFTAYLLAGVALSVVGFLLGAWRFTATECDEGEGECDLAALAGMLWAVGALSLFTAAVLVRELLLWNRRRHSVAAAGRLEPT